MNKNKKSIDEIAEFWKVYQTSRPNKYSNNLSLIEIFIGLILLICIVSYFIFKTEEPKPISKKEQIEQEKVLRGILYTKEENEGYTTNIELHQSELNQLKKEVESLKTQKEELLSDLEKKKQSLRSEMVLKKEIKETEFSVANGEGFSEGYEAGIQEGRRQNSGSGFGGGFLMETLLSN